jgi:hypothetical protein
MAKLWSRSGRVALRRLNRRRPAGEYPLSMSGPVLRVGQPASRRPGFIPSPSWSQRAMRSSPSLGSPIGSATATAPDPVGMNGRRGSRSLAKSPSSGGPSSRNSQDGTSRRCGGMSFHTAFHKSTRTASGMPNTTTAMATIPTRHLSRRSSGRCRLGRRGGNRAWASEVTGVGVSPGHCHSSDRREASLELRAGGDRCRVGGADVAKHPGVGLFCHGVHGVPSYASRPGQCRQLQPAAQRQGQDGGALGSLRPR